MSTNIEKSAVVTAHGSPGVLVRWLLLLPWLVCWAAGVSAQVPPTLHCPRDFTTGTCNTGMVVHFEVSATPNCGRTVTLTCNPTNDSFLSAGVHAIRCTAEDPECRVSSVCTFTVTVVQDTTRPTIACPANLMVSCPAEVPPRPATLAEFIYQGGWASDDCKSNLTYSCVDGTLNGGPCAGTIDRVHTVVDSAGNLARCVQVIAVRDTNSPAIHCPPHLLVPDMASIPSRPGSLEEFLRTGGVATGHCNGPLIYHCQDGERTGLACGGSFVRTHTVIDICANSNGCEQVITFAGPPDPTLTCPAPVAVSCLEEIPACPASLAEFIAVGGKAAGIDLRYNCSDGPVIGSSCQGRLLRTHRVTDSCGKTAEGTQLMAFNPERTIPPADPLIHGIHVSATGQIAVEYLSDPDSYFVLRRGETVTTSWNAVDTALGVLRSGWLADPPGARGSMGFYRVEQVPISHPLDLDRDGMDDVWELNHAPGLSPLEAGDASLPSGAGRTRLEEYERFIRNPAIPANGSQSATVRLLPGGRVLSSRIRMDAPGALLQLAAAAQRTGDRNTPLSRWVGRNTLEALLGAALDKVAINPTPSIVGSLADFSPYAQLLDSAGLYLNPLFAPDYAPDELVFPALYQGGFAEATLKVTSITDGPVSASLPVDHNFKIVKMRAVTGSTSGKALATQTIVSPPWTVDALAGQDVLVTVRFSPEFDLGDNVAGPKTSTLEVNGAHWKVSEPMQPSWSIKVPVKGQFKGYSLPPMIATPQSAAFNVFIPAAYNPNQPEIVTADVTLINTGPAINGTIHASNLPPGVSFTTTPFNLQALETKSIAMPLQISRMDVDGIWFNDHENPHTAILVCEAQGSTHEILVEITVYDGVAEWSMDFDLASCDGFAKLYLHSTGYFLFTSTGYNENLLWWRQISFAGYFDGQQYVNMGLTAEADAVFHNEYGFVRQEYKEHYIDFINQSFFLNVSVKGPGF